MGILFFVELNNAIPLIAFDGISIMNADAFVFEMVAILNVITSKIHIKLYVIKYV